MKFPGHMTAAEALAHGFTHHGKYHGIPVWLSPASPSFQVATKWAPMEALMTVVTTLEAVFSDAFKFKVGQPIEVTYAR